MDQVEHVYVPVTVDILPGVAGRRGRLASRVAPRRKPTEASSNQEGSACKNIPPPTAGGWIECSLQIKTQGQLGSKRPPAAQLRKEGAVRKAPPLTLEREPLAVLL